MRPAISTLLPAQKSYRIVGEIPATHLAYVIRFTASALSVSDLERYRDVQPEHSMELVHNRSGRRRSSQSGSLSNIRPAQSATAAVNQSALRKANVDIRRDRSAIARSFFNRQIELTRHRRVDGEGGHLEDNSASLIEPAPAFSSPLGRASA